MTVAMWGGGTPTDLATRIKTGDVALDFYRPVGILGWYLAADVGRAVFHLLSRGLAPTLVGAVLFDLRYPAGPLVWVVFFASVALALLVSFAIRFLVAMSAFWILDDQGTQVLTSAAAVFFSGLTVPLVLFPGWFGVPRPGAALGVVPPGARRPVAGQGGGLGRARRPRPPGALGGRAAGRLPAAARRGRAQGGGPGWLRP